MELQTEIKKLGNCLSCGNPIMMIWENKKKTKGHSQRYTETLHGTYHYDCTGGKSLAQLNEERKLI